MKVIFDIGALGSGFADRWKSTGIVRVTETIALGLAASEDCDLVLSSSEQLSGSVAYLKTNRSLDSVPLAVAGLARPRLELAHSLRDTVGRIELGNYSRPELFVRKAVRWLLFAGSNLVEVRDVAINPRDLRSADIFHSSFYRLPDYLRRVSPAKRFLSVYDLIPILFSHSFGSWQHPWFTEIIDSLGDDDFAICPSQSAKDDLCGYKPIDPSRVFVTPLAASDAFYPYQDVAGLAAVRRKYGIPPDVPYILSLSAIEPRKNIEHTIRCFANLVREERIGDLHLVLAGEKSTGVRESVTEALSECSWAQDRIIMTGYVEDADLAALYSGALVFTFMSLYEGFGLPPLEAMRCGVPVITSNTSSLPEVVADAGITLDPTDSDALSQSLLDLYTRPALRQALSSKSLERARQFSWQRCIEQTIGAYRTALSFGG